MSLTTDERQTLIQLHLEKSHTCFRDGEQLIQIGSISAAANRFYYAIFHSIHALFVANEIISKSHHGMNAQFHQHFIKTGVIDPKYGRLVAMMENMREKADYDVVYDVSLEDLESLKPLAYELTSKIEQIIKL